jgi:hypothetical protein
VSYKEYILSDSSMRVVVIDRQRQEFRIAASKIDNIAITGNYIHVIEIEAVEAEKQKIDAVLKYCEGNTEIMWAATIVGILLNCEFRDAKAALAKYRGNE